MNYKMIPVCLIAALLAACSQQSAEEGETSGTTQTTGAATHSERLGALVEAYFDDYLELNPVRATLVGDPRFNDRLANDIGAEHREQSLALERRYLESVREIDAGALQGQDQLTYEVFARGREEAIEGHRHPLHLGPVSQFSFYPSFFALLGSGAGAQPFHTVEDYDNWLARTEGIVAWMDQAIENMREGMQRGIVQPRVLMERALPQVAGQITDDPRQSVFYRPIESFPEAVPPAERERLEQAYLEMIDARLVPAYRRLHDFIRDEYLPAARDTVGLSALPGGREVYDFLVRLFTTSGIPAEAIHELGLAEVARIRAEMEAVMEAVEFEGPLAEFFDFVRTDDRFYFDQPRELLDGYLELKKVIDSRLPRLFLDFPKADYEVREVEAFRAQSAAGASYQRPSPDGSRPGIFYINTYNLRAQPRFGMETLSLHEAAPGHHFQIAIAQEIEALPRFRRFGTYVAYVEGWALYAESLGKELGLFTDPYSWYGRLNDEMLRAMRLVVDTGLHIKGWTRGQAIEYMLANSSMAETDVVAEVERYIAIPGQALGYKIGELKIAELRARAEERLGEHFDIKAFHSEMLRGGALPLSVLEGTTERWIESQRSAGDGQGMAR